MKTKILLSFVIIFFTKSTLNAQINEGKYILGGSASVNSESGQTLNSESTTIQIGKVVKSNTIIGIFGTVSLSKDSSEHALDKSNQFNVGVFYRKYKSLGNNFYFFGEIDVSFQHNKYETDYIDNATPTSSQHQSIGTKYNGVGLDFIPGISYSICKRMQIELMMPNIASIFYGNNKTYGISPPQKTNNFSVNANLNSNLLSNFGIGFKFLLGK